jgi:Fe2+ or Zn2+ uptake regulation protein
MDKEKLFIQRLKTNNERVTSPRTALFRSLLHHGATPITVLVEELRQQSIDASTTYRNINLFRNLHIISDVAAGQRRIIELSDDFSHHHHHFMCRNCGKLTDINSSSLEQALSDIASQHGLQVSAHHIEMSGLCKDCKQ